MSICLYYTQLQNFSSHHGDAVIDKLTVLTKLSAGLFVSLSVCQCVFLLVCPKMVVFGVDLGFTADVYLFIFISPRYLEIRWPIGIKFCTVVETEQNYIMQVQKFGCPFQKHFRFQKHAKFCPTLDVFRFLPWIFLEWMKIFKVRQVLDQSRFLASLAKK